MNASQHLTEQMKEKTDQQVLDILSKPGDWSSEALGAATAELQKRGIPIPELPPPPPPLSEAEERMNRLKRSGWLLLVGGLIAAAIVGNIKPDAWPKFGDGSPVIEVAASIFSSACWIIGIVVLIRAAYITRVTKTDGTQSPQKATPPTKIKLRPSRASAILGIIGIVLFVGSIIIRSLSWGLAAGLDFGNMSPAMVLGLLLLFVSIILEFIVRGKQPAIVAAQSRVISRHKALLKRVVFIVLWMAAFLLVAFVSILVAGLILDHDMRVSLDDSKFFTVILFAFGYGMPALGLILGLFGKLPGTRRSKRQQGDFGL